VRHRAILLEMVRCALLAASGLSLGTNGWNDSNRLQLELRKMAEGRAAITRLIDDENITVRKWSAAYALVWEPTVAEAALQQMAASGGSVASRQR